MTALVVYIFIKDFNFKECLLTSAEYSLLSNLFDPEIGGSTFLRHIGKYTPDLSATLIRK
jgi:hypothetical protein